MNRRRLTATTAMFAGVLAGVLGVARCQGGGTDLTQAETGQVRVGYPVGWARAAGEPRFTVRKLEGGRMVAQLTVLERVAKTTTRHRPAAGNADNADAVDAGRFFQQDVTRGTGGVSKGVEVDGAEDARRFDYTYTSVVGPASGTD